MKEIILIIVLVVVLIAVAISIYLYISQSSSQPIQQQPTQQSETSKPNQPSGFKISPSTTSNIPVDCELSEWSKWSECDSSGVQRKQRTVIVEPKNGGNPCGVLTEEMLCKVDCKLSEWTDWGKCDSSNIQERKRTILIDPKNGGNPCGNLVEKKTCPITTTTPSTPKCPTPNDNKDENYTFSNIPKLGSEILKTIKEKFSILLKKENFALSSNIVEDISKIDLNSYYYIGTRNASGDYPNCMLEIPFRVYRLAPTPV